MKWIKYEYVCGTNADGSETLAKKRVGYNETNLAIAQNEAYNGEYTIEDDGKEYPSTAVIPADADMKGNRITNLGDPVENADAISKLFATKNFMAKNQGAENVGLIPCVGTDGNLTLVPMPEASIDGDVVGVLDDSNNILLSGNLANGTYQLRWSLGDGTYTDAGELIVSQSGYSIFTSLSHCSASGATSIRGNASATIVIIADGDYTLPNNITVSGAEYTWDKNTGMIVLSNPTSDVYITVAAVTAVTVDIGLVENKRFSISSMDVVDASNHTATEWIDLTTIPKPCTIHLTGIIWAALSQDSYINTIAHGIKNAVGEKVSADYTYPTITGNHEVVVNNDDGTDVTVIITSDKAAKIRLAGKGAIANASATLTYLPES